MDYKSFFDSDDYIAGLQGRRTDTVPFPPAVPRTAEPPAACGAVSSPDTVAPVGRDTPFDRLGFPLAIAYVPMQAWRNLYDAEIGLTRGTVFRELDKPFCAGEVSRGR